MFRLLKPLPSLPKVTGGQPSLVSAWRVVRPGEEEVMWPGTASPGDSGPKRGPPPDTEDARTQEEVSPGIPGLRQSTVSCVTIDKLLNLYGPWSTPSIYIVPQTRDFSSSIHPPPDALMTGLCLMPTDAQRLPGRGIYRKGRLWSIPERGTQIQALG